MVSGLSNQEFGSTFRSIPFPFTNKQEQSSLEIYHAAHGQYETNSPIKTFTTAELNGKKFLVASYTCTPLVLFPIDDLKPGTHVKGRTVGEFGAGNSPLDIITMKKGNDLFLIMANSDRPVMKIKYKDIETYEGSLTEPIKENYSTAGVPYVSFPMVNVLQLDKLDDTQFVFLQRRSTETLTSELPITDHYEKKSTNQLAQPTDSFSLFLLVRCAGSQDTSQKNIIIRWKNNQAVGLSMALSQFKAHSKETLPELLKVQLTNSKTAILGDYSIQSDSVIFEPLIPFTPSLRYEVLLENRLVGEIDIPQVVPSTTLMGIYPSQDTLPENLLKFYFVFLVP